MSVAMPNNGGCCCPAGDCAPVANVSIAPPGGAAPIVLAAVVLTGTPPFLYQWRAEGVDIPGATSQTLEVDPPADTNYTVAVTNNCGEAESPRVVVTTGPPCVPPTAVIEPPNVGNDPLPNPSLLLAVVAGTPPFTYQWQEAPNLLGNVPGLFVDIPGATAASLVAAPFDRTWYLVIVSNDCGEAQAVPVLVGSPPN